MSGNRRIARNVAIVATALGLWGALVLLLDRCPGCPLQEFRFIETPVAQLGGSVAAFPFWRKELGLRLPARRGGLKAKEEQASAL